MESCRVNLFTLQNDIKESPFRRLKWSGRHVKLK